MPVLTSAGVLQGGLISDAARLSFVDDVVKILEIGSDNALAGSLPHSMNIVGSTFLSRNFAADSLEEHASRFPVWHKVFIDFMFQTTANALDIDGSMPLAPIVDYTAIFSGFGFPQRQVSLSEFAVGMMLVDPTFQTQLQFFFDVDVLDITPELLVDIAASIPIPSLPLPPIPQPGLNLVGSLPQFDPRFPSVDLSKLVVPTPPPLQFPNVLPLPVIGFVLCAVIEAVPKVLGLLIARAMAGDLIKALADGPVGLTVFVGAVVIDAVASCLGVQLRNLGTFLAAFIVYIERLTAMLAVVLIGCIFGEGQLIVTTANALGLT
jgi:hypothetical protein